MRRFIGISLAVLALAGVAYAAGVAKKVTSTVTLSAATAALCPTATLAGRNSVMYCNYDSATIWIGSANTVTNTSNTGDSLGAGTIAAPSCITYPISADSAANGAFYCYSVAGTSAGEVIITESRTGPL